MGVAPALFGNYGVILNGRLNVPKARPYKFWLF